MERTFNYEIMEEIKRRWSPRALSSEKVPVDEVMALLEAARYAPSCFNEQPWRFLVANSEKSLAKMRSVLSANNRDWAEKAPVLILVASKTDFDRDGRENYWHRFDTGAAWGYLALEAERRGLIAHAMGGFDKDAAHRLFSIDENFELMAVVAVGKYGNPDELPERFKEREHPGLRRELELSLLKS